MSGVMRETLVFNILRLFHAKIRPVSRVDSDVRSFTVHLRPGSAHEKTDFNIITLFSLKICPVSSILQLHLHRHAGFTGVFNKRPVDR